MNSESDSDNKCPKSVFGKRLGTLLLVSGGSFTGVFLARQIKEATVGHTYLEFIILGLVIAAIGLGIIISNRRKKQGP